MSDPGVTLDIKELTGLELPNGPFNTLAGDAVIGMGAEPQDTDLNAEPTAGTADQWFPAEASRRRASCIGSFSGRRQSVHSRDELDDD